MTIGVYKLNFSNTSKCYIGQSVNICKRFNEHLNSMKKGIAKPKLQAAYNVYGIPTLEILLECNIEELDEIELNAIEIYDSIANGFNTLAYTGNPDIRGYHSTHAKLSKEEYIEIFRLLADTDMAIIDIADAMDTSSTIVSKIFIGATHQWLYSELPEYSAKVLEKRLLGRYYKNMPKLSDRKLISPDNIVYTIINIREFCREHKLESSHISSVLRGIRKSHKGWKKI